MMRKSKLLSVLLVIGLLATLSFGMVHAQEKIKVRWYVGLGGGTDPGLPEKQQAVVDAYNASQDKIELSLEVVANAQAYNVLNTEIAADNAPDIVGPMGVRGRASFPGAWLDLTDQIAKNSYDLTDFDPALVQFYHIKDGGQVGIPFAVYPSFMMFNKKLFDEADLAYPPKNYGDQYVATDGTKSDWTLDTVEGLAKILTVDSAGNDATMDEFDNTQIVQWGFGVSHTDMRGRDTLFGAANFVDADGKAVIPEQWRKAENWYHDAMYGKQAFYPSGAYSSSDLLAAGNWFGSGHVAMNLIHQWYMGWGTADLKDGWDLAPVPSVDGVTTAKLHADTFGVMRYTKNPDAAFEVLTYLLGEKANELATIYGGMPARLSLQADFYPSFQKNLESQYPDADFNVNWPVAVQALSYPDNPNHEEGMPSFLESTDAYTAYAQIVDNNADADVNAELDKLQVDLQAIFDAAAKATS
ncbi:MAG: extracellular solute-binding protein [Chloroflexota bacterium]